MLGGFLALLSALTFTIETATARRGVLTASVVQALSITIPMGVPIFFLAASLGGGLAAIAGFSLASFVYLSLAGILHFVWGRYCNYRACRAMGINLVAPVQQSSLLVTLALAIWILGERLTPLHLVGIIFVIIGPMLTYDPPPKDKEDKDKEKAAPPVAASHGAVFQPKYGEGYIFALLSSTGYGVSPVLVKLAFERQDVAQSLGGGLISYAAATIAFVLLAVGTGQVRSIAAIDRGAIRWFMVSGVCVCFAQMFRYMALAVAPVSVVTPILRLSLIFRFWVSRVINPQHEVFGGRMVFGTFVSLAGVLSLSSSPELLQSLLPLPDWAMTLLAWRWP